MACVWIPLTKLFQCAEKFNSSSEVTKKFFNRNGAVRGNIFRSIKKKSMLIVPSLCGIVGEKEKKTPNAREEVVHNVAMATIALKDGNIENSEKMLMKTLDLAETINFSLGVISVCDILSSLAMKLGDYEKAEDLLIRALKNLLAQGAPEDDNFVLSFNLKLCRIYSTNGNDELAELGFKNCMSIQQNKLERNRDEETHLLWTTTLYWYGKFLLAKNRFKEAKSCFQDCYLNSLRVNDLVPSQIMVILYNLGEVCQNLGEHDEAFEHFLKGVALDKKRNNPDLTYFYTKLGMVSMCRGLIKEAKRWCEKGKMFAFKYQNFDAQKESNECLEKISDLVT